MFFGTLGNFTKLRLFRKHASPVFVLSTGRCGSRLITEVCHLAGQGRLEAVHEPDDWSKLVPLSKAFYENGRLLEEGIQTIKSYRNNLGSTYVESSLWLVPYTLAIADVYPRARFIHLVRDGRDFVRSALSRGWYGDRRGRPGLLAWRDIEWEPLESDSAHEGWATMGPFERACWYFKKKTAMIIQDLCSAQVKNLRLRVEDLGEKEPLLELCDFLEIAPPRDWTAVFRRVSANPNSNAENNIPYVIPHWLEWNEKLKKSYEFHVGTLHWNLGYGGFESSKRKLVFK